MSEVLKYPVMTNEGLIILINLPNNGAPIAAATPWNINRTPNAFVSNSSPTSSTIIVDLKDAKHAEIEKHNNSKIVHKKKVDGYVCESVCEVNNFLHIL